jgi:4-hydroxy-tetrahydrodipicolinate reductase
MDTENSSTCYKVQRPVIVVGAGKLATELLSSLEVDRQTLVIPWVSGIAANQSIIVHAGSGRELEAVTAYCAATQSPLIELATGSKITPARHAFPVVLCPNTNILMLKFMSMLEQSGHLFRGHQITLAESHQAQKTSVPGTAVSMAHALGLKDSDVLSIRDVNRQLADLEIPEEHLARHAYHRILVEDGACSVKLETRVYGESPYADGVGRIVAAVQNQALENRFYPIMEFVNNGWI